MAQPSLAIDVDCLRRRYRLKEDAAQALALGCRELGCDAEEVFRFARHLARAGRRGRIEAMHVLMAIRFVNWHPVYELDDSVPTEAVEINGRETVTEGR